MNYNLQSVELKNFGGWPICTVEFKEPLTMITGGNNVGKSTIRDGIEFALTGKARGIKTKKGMVSIVHNGTNPKFAGVKLNFNGDASITRTLKSSDKTPVDDNPLLPFCLDPMRFVRMGADERCTIVADLAKEKTPASKIIKKICGEFPAEAIAEMAKSQADIDNIDQVREAVVNARRDAKRQLTTAEQLANGVRESMVTIGGRSIGVTSKTHEQLDNRIVEVKKERDEAVAEWGKLGFVGTTEPPKTEGLIDVQKSLEKSLVELNGGDLQAKIDTRSNDLKSLDAPIGTLRRKQAQNTLAIEQSEERLIALKESSLKDDASCPTCGAELKKDFLKELIDTLEGDIKLLNADLNILNKKLVAETSKRQKLVAEKDAAQTSLNTIEIQRTRTSEGIEKIKTQISSVGQWLILKEKIDKSANILEALEAWKREKTAFDEWVTAKNKADTQLEPLQTLIDRCNELDEQLGPDGLVRQKIAESGSSIDLNKKLLKAWGVESMDVQSNGEIIFDGRPIELASESEKYRIASVIALWFANVGDVGFACLDAFDILSKSNRNAFFSAVKSATKTLGKIVIFVTSEQKFDKSPASVGIYKITPDRKILKVA